MDKLSAPGHAAPLNQSWEVPCAGWTEGAPVLRSPASLATALQQDAADKQSDPEHAAAFLRAMGLGGVAIFMQRAQARKQRSIKRHSARLPHLPASLGSDLMDSLDLPSPDEPSAPLRDNDQAVHAPPPDSSGLQGLQPPATTRSADWTEVTGIGQGRRTSSVGHCHVGEDAHVATPLLQDAQQPPAFPSPLVNQDPGTQPRDFAHLQTMPVPDRRRGQTGLPCLKNLQLQLQLQDGMGRAALCL